MKYRLILLPLAAPMLLAAAAPQEAEEAQAEATSDAEADEVDPNDQRAPNAGEIARDAAMQPLVDTNIKKREINPLLAEAADNPYSLDGIRRCDDIAFALMRLDDVLGPDVDDLDPMTVGQKRRKAAGEVTKGLVGGLIPFRGVVREITGAGDAQRRQHAAWEAGLIRRAFLKGYAAARRCKRRPAAAEATAARE